MIFSEHAHAQFELRQLQQYKRFSFDKEKRLFIEKQVGQRRCRK